MTKQEFEEHLEFIVIFSKLIERGKDNDSEVARQTKEMLHHKHALTELFDSRFAPKEPETLQELMNRKDDIEFHMGWNCSSDSFEYQCYEEDLQEVQKKIDELTQEETK